jgi:hypothetical protein
MILRDCIVELDGNVGMLLTVASAARLKEEEWSEVTLTDCTDENGEYCSSSCGTLASSWSAGGGSDGRFFRRLVLVVVGLDGITSIL